MRYLLLAGLFERYFFFWWKERWQKYLVEKKPRKKGQVRVEILNSLITCLIFGVMTSLLVYLWQVGQTKVYLQINDYPIWYLPLSLLLSLFIHETYYYWLHRLMHRRPYYKIMHKTHHNSLTSSPWTSFSFHPIEAFFQALIFFPILIFIPLHPIIIIIQLTLMSVSSVINHLNIEIYPSLNHWFFKYWIGATHHALHHRNFTTNYGLYFTFWDRLCGTEDESK